MSNTKNEIRVAHIIGRLIPGGVERRTLELIQHSQDPRLTHFVCVTSGKKGTLDAEYENSGAHLRPMRIRSLSFWVRFYRMLRQESIDVVHSNIMYMSGPILMTAWAAGVKKRIVHFRTDGNLRLETHFQNVRTALLKKMIAWFATDIIGLTPANLELAWTKTWKDDPRCRVLPNGVPLPSFETLVTEDLAPFINHTIILHVGRADLPTKNREKAITAFASYSKTNSKAVLIFVGRDGKNEEQSKEQLNRWKSLAEEHGIEDKVIFLGEQSSIPSYYFGADILLFTSTKEGLPGVIIEALASGLPVVASNVPGAKFVADNSANIATLDPSWDDSFWSNELLKLSPKLSRQERETNMNKFHSTIFTINNATRNYTRLWTK